VNGLVLRISLLTIPCCSKNFKVADSVFELIPDMRNSSLKRFGPVNSCRSELVNHIEDLYADDIAIKVIRESGFLRDDQLSAFLQEWVKDEPVESNDARREMGQLGDHGKQCSRIGANDETRNSRHGRKGRGF